MRSPSITIARVLALGLALAALFAALAPARSLADVDPAGCTDEVAYDPAHPDVRGRRRAPARRRPDRQQRP